MKFLFTVASYFPIIGGVQMVTQNMAEELVKQGHNVTVLISRQKGLEELNNYNGVYLEYFDLHTEKDKIVGNTENYISYIKKKSESIDVLVNISVHSAMTDVLLRHINELKCVSILYLHGIYEFSWSKKDKSSTKRIISKLYYNLRRIKFYNYFHKYAINYDLIIHLSKEDISMKYMEKYNITQNLIIHNSVGKSFFLDSNKKCNVDYFLHVANYAEHKNQEFSLRAFYSFNNCNVKMIYIGAKENDYYRYLLKLNTSLELKYGKRNIEFFTNLNRNETIDKIKNAKAIILSSRVEKFPMVLVEGMACGKPFISTDCGIVKELPGGLVVNNINEMRLCMEKINKDSIFVEELSKDGKEYAIKNFSLEKNINIFIDAIEGIMYEKK